MWRMYVVVCACGVCTLERVLAICNLQFRFVLYLTLGYTYGVRVDKGT